MKHIFLICTIFVLSIFISKADNRDNEEFGHKCATFSPNRSSILNKLAVSGNRPQLEFDYKSKSGKFLIHYAALGNHAVDNIDKNNNGVPDYVELVAFYFDSVYAVEVEQMGYLSPIPDNNLGGTNEYDIYIQETGTGSINEAFYGMTVPEQQILPQRKFERDYSFIIIDNNFSETDSVTNNSGKKIKMFKETGEMGLKITAAHEFHHAVQFMYGFPEPNTGSINEMVSTYMENRLFPESQDFLQYVNAMLGNLEKYRFGSGNASFGYSYNVFFHHLNNKFGESACKKMWENIYDGEPAYFALESSLQILNSSLRQEWTEFLPALYNTGNRSYQLPSMMFAEKMNNVVFYEAHKIKLDGDYNLSFSLLPYEARFIRLIIENSIKTDDTIDVALCDADLTGAGYQMNQSLSGSFTISTQNSLGMMPIADSRYFIKYYDLQSNLIDTVFYRPGATTQVLATAYPSPYNFKSDEYIYIPVSEKTQPGKIILLTIYDSELVSIYSKYQTMEYDNFNRVLRWSPKAENCKTGIYFYSVKDGDNEEFGKFVITE